MLVNVLSMPNGHNDNQKKLSFYYVHYPIIAYPDAILSLNTFQLFHGWRIWIVAQGSYGRADSVLNGAGERFNLPLSFWGDKNAISQDDPMTDLIQPRIVPKE